MGSRRGYRSPNAITGSRETVEFDGYLFHRYPDHPRKHRRRYFYGARGFLHRYVWAKHHGEIPSGCVIHHVDGDFSNNNLENLACMPLGEHSRKHWDAGDIQANSPEWMAEIRGKAAEWHKSEEGRAWHREHVKNSLTKRKKLPGLVCKGCSAEFENYSGTKYCSRKCAGKHRVRVPSIDKQCPCCGRDFKAMRREAKYCSKSCNKRAYHQARQASRGLQSSG